MYKKTPYQQGFTLIEVLMTTSIAAIMLSIAAPNFTTLIKNTRMTSAVNEFIGVLYLSRSEAIKRGKTVTLCKSSNGTACITTGNWEQGWVVFEDKNNDAVIDVGEDVIRINEGFESGNSMTMVGNSVNVSSRISYLPTGRITNFGIGGTTVFLCDGRSGDIGKNVVISRTGRFRIDTRVTCP